MILQRPERGCLSAVQKVGYLLSVLSKSAVFALWTYASLLVGGFHRGHGKGCEGFGSGFSGVARGGGGGLPQFFASSRNLSQLRCNFFQLNSTLSPKLQIPPLFFFLSIDNNRNLFRIVV